MTTEHTCTRHAPGSAACAGGPHRCPCQPCRTANNRQHKRSRLGLSDLMPAAPVQAHLNRLVAAGYSTNGIALAAGLSNAQVIYTLNTAKRIQRRTARRLLAVTDPTGRVEATGTRRRLQALAALGWSFTAMAEHLGLSRAAVHHWTTRDRVAAESAHAARRLYDDLWNKRPPETTPMERMIANRNRNTAAKYGWPPPLAYDDEDIDSPDPEVDKIARTNAGLVRLSRWDDIDTRFWGRVEKNGHDGCWLWTGPVTRKGYGQRVGHQGVNYYPHRLAYELLVGPIADGLTIDHLCRNRLCVNPDHLEPVTSAENTARAVESRKAEPCPNGHPPEHRRTMPSASGKSICTECRRVSDRARDERDRDKRRAAARDRYSRAAPQKKNGWGVTVGNVEFLAAAGGLLPGIAAQLGIAEKSVRRQLERANRQDLLARITPDLNPIRGDNNTKGRAA